MLKHCAKEKLTDIDDKNKIQEMNWRFFFAPCFSLAIKFCEGKVAINLKKN